MRYCIFGGSFDPPHEAHRYLARSARESLRLDTVLWVPSQDPPHRPKPSTPFPDRLAMVRLAIAGLPGQEVSDIEERLPSPSYSLQTIQALKAEKGAQHEWHFLVGADNWDIIQTWHRWEDVLKEVTMVVFPRGGRPIKVLPAGVKRLDLPELDLEARQIRQILVESGDLNAAGLLPELRPYIQSHGLYGFSPRGPSTP